MCFTVAGFQIDYNFPPWTLYLTFKETRSTLCQYTNVGVCVWHTRDEREAHDYDWFFNYCRTSGSTVMKTGQLRESVFASFECTHRGIRISVLLRNFSRSCRVSTETDRAQVPACRTGGAIIPGSTLVSMRRRQSK